MPLGYSFATVDEAKLRLGGDPAVDDSDDEVLADLLEEAGQEFVSMAGGHYFGPPALVTWTVLTRGGSSLVLPQAPVSVASLRTNANGGGVTVLEDVLADDFYLKGRILRRADGRNFPAAPGFAVVTATIGYSAVPEDARGAVLTLLSHRYRGRVRASTVLEQAVDQAKPRGRDSTPALPRSVAIAVRKYAGVARGF